jgi:hypothetical protein
MGRVASPLVRKGLRWGITRSHVTACALWMVRTQPDRMWRSAMLACRGPGADLSWSLPFLERATMMPSSASFASTSAVRALRGLAA